MQWYHTSKLSMFSCKSFAGAIHVPLANIIHAT
jgi:hypothetical protein